MLPDLPNKHITNIYINHKNINDLKYYKEIHDQLAFNCDSINYKK